MEPFCFDFSNEEISTILFCMEYFKNCHIKADTSEQQQIHNNYCLSVSRKLLTKNTTFSINEYTRMYSAIYYVSMLCDGMFNVDDKTRSACINHQTVVNKLLQKIPEIDF